MPRTGRRGGNREEELPDAMRRVADEAQESFARVYEGSAGEEGQAPAYSTLKRAAEEVRDFVVKDQPVPLDLQAGAPEADPGPGRGGVDLMEATKKQLYERARQLDVRGRSRMSKAELAEAVAHAQA